MKKHLLLIILSLFAVATFGQTKIYLNDTLGIEKNEKQATYYRLYDVNADSSVSFKDYFLSDSTLHIIGKCKDIAQKIFNGTFIFYNHGKIISEGEIENGALEGRWKYYWLNGNLKEVKIFDGGEETGETFEYDRSGRKLFEGKILNDLLEEYCVGYDNITNNKTIEGTYLHGLKNGHFKYYYPSGELYLEGDFINQKFINIWKQFDKNGSVICKTDFGTDTSKKIEDNCFRNQMIYRFVQQMPSFVGGEESMMKFIMENLHYPQEARDHQIEGKVVAQFVINTDGIISDIKIVRDIGYGCGKAVIDILEKMNGKWNSGRQDGKPVKVQFTLPIDFHLD